MNREQEETVTRDLNKSILLALGDGYERGYQQKYEKEADLYNVIKCKKTGLVFCLSSQFDYGAKQKIEIYIRALRDFRNEVIYSAFSFPQPRINIKKSPERIAKEIKTRFIEKSIGEFLKLMEVQEKRAIAFEKDKEITADFRDITGQLKRENETELELLKKIEIPYIPDGVRCVGTISRSGDTIKTNLTIANLSFELTRAIIELILDDRKKE